MATVFDCLRKTDTSLVFRACALHALGTILPGCVEFTSSKDTNSNAATSSRSNPSLTLCESLAIADEDDHVGGNAELLAFIDKVWQVVERQLNSVQSWEESALIFTCLQRLVNAVVPTTLEQVPSRS